MIFNPNIGKIYDSVFFLTEYFNKSEIESEYKKSYEDTWMMFEFYDEIHKNITEVPPMLEPLFSIGNGEASVISKFFMKEIYYCKDNINTFIEKIRSNTDELYQYTVDSLFYNYEKSENKKIMPTIAPGNYINAINSLEIPSEQKLQIALLIGNFNYAISLLIDKLRSIYSVIDEFHEKHAKELTLEFEKIQSEKNIKMYSESFQYDNNASTGTGKTTLITYLAEKGCPYINDDNVLIDMDTLNVVTNITPVHLRPESLSVLRKYGCIIEGNEINIENFHRVVYLPKSTDSVNLPVGGLFL